MVSVRRHELHRDVLLLHHGSSLSVQTFVWCEHVLGVEAAHHVRAFNVVVLEVHENFVADTWSEEGSSARCGHRRGYAHPGSGHLFHCLLDGFSQCVPVSFQLFLLGTGSFEVSLCFLVLLSNFVVVFLVFADDGVVLLRILVVSTAFLLVVLLSGIYHVVDKGFLPALSILQLLYLGILFLYFGFEILNLGLIVLILRILLLQFFGLIVQGKPFSFELLRAIVGCRLIFFNNLLPLFGRGIDVAYQVLHIFIIFGLKLHQLLLVLLESFQIVIDLLELLLCFFQLVFQCAITCLPGEGYSHSSLILRVLIGCDESRLRAYLACYGHRLHRRIEGLGVALLICRNGINLQRALAIERIVGHGVVLVIVAAPCLFGVLLYLNDDISAVDAVDVNHLSQLDGYEGGAHVDADYLPLLRHFKGVDVTVVVELGPASLGE